MFHSQIFNSFNNIDFVQFNFSEDVETRIFLHLTMIARNEMKLQANHSRVCSYLNRFAHIQNTKFREAKD